MLKLAGLTIPGALLVLLWSSGAIANPHPPTTPTVTDDTPLCYFQTGQQRINLDALCGASTRSQSALSAAIAIQPDRITGSSEESGVAAADFAALASTGKMWDVNTTSQRGR